MTEKQEHLLQLFRELDEICKKNNLRYVMAGGTAIGVVRNEGFIPWDDDVDMVVERKYIERLLDAIEQRYPDRYFVEAPLRTPGYLSSFIQIHRKKHSVSGIFRDPGRTMWN